ncbi:glycoside hydrolase family 5 protein [Rhizopogon vinicolor AM-OR11-026]|uniref:glucan 1,3-beta-glucosidase n=1 Tax=Rhizopogon vinicolor AM-OR11-026 TaxID=1314800 RepID=A0A1B7N241_9AGAM|nr:glycoside hydrolase family 5 protein [Rhizopogon vinicolor AM-OR11-026]
MSPNNPHSPNIPYDPLPLTQDQPGDFLHNDPPSPHASGFDTPPVEMTHFSDSVPSGAPNPRFLGRALYDDPSMNFRDSYASQNTFQTAPSAANSSVYALNPDRATPTQAEFAGTYHDDPRDTENNAAATSGSNYLAEKRSAYAAPRNKSKRGLIIGAAIFAAVIVLVAVIVPIYFTVIKPKSSTDSAAAASSAAANPTSTAQPGSTNVVTGGDGSKITTEDGTTFTYSNPFGGTWYWDPKDPFNNNAQAQSWTPPLNQTFQFGTDRIFGVNLGGWLTTEPVSSIFIAPALYEKYQTTTPQAVDEWTLSQAMAADTASGGLQQLETHYETFITEQDFAEIAGAGLNFVRIPLPYWAIETRSGEPFLAKTAWKYFLMAIQWARKYGIRINLDFHALPGSQNGWNHSGKLGTVNVLYGPMGLANAQRSLDYIRIIAELISQPEYRDVVVMFGITNEPQGSMMGQGVLERYYMQAYDHVRTASGVGEGNGPYISYHDGFLGLNQWTDYLPNADRISLDQHPYLCFEGQSDSPMSSYAQTPCSDWAAGVNTSMASFGMTTAGEFSNAVTDCGLWVNGVGLGTRYEGTYTPGTWPVVGNCSTWTDWQTWDSTMKTGIEQFALASMDALQNWFFWTWKIGNSSVSGVVESPQWSYQLGLQNGWMPTDPRTAAGTCADQGLYSPPLKAWQTGGAGAGQIAASVTASYAWPPASISNGGPVSSLPSYTPTGTVATLPPPTFTITSGSSVTTANAGDGWQNPSDTASGMVGIATCSYLNPWIGDAAPPSPLCSGATARAVPRSLFTAAPARRS